MQEFNKYTSNIESFILASFLCSYPDDEFTEHVKVLLDNIDVSLDFYDELIDIVNSPVTLNNLRSKYIEIFDKSKSVNPLYETEYGRARSMFKASELADIAGFYNAFGFEVGGNTCYEVHDHIAVELEFYSLLKMKLNNEVYENNLDNAKIVRDAMKDFLNDHLGRFPRSILRRPGVNSDKFYYQVFSFIDSIVREECRLFGIQPDEALWLESESSLGSMECGGTGKL